MYCKYYLNSEEESIGKRLLVEDFGAAFVCEGRVFLRETVRHRINTAPGQCWGEYIEIPGGAFLDGEYLKRPTSVCIDDVGQSYIITEIISTEPLRIKSIRHIGVDFTEEHREDSAGLIYERKYDRLRIMGCTKGIAELLLPCEINGMTVGRVDLSPADLKDVETLIISEGIEELSIDFSSAKKLRRLVIPTEIQLVRPLDYISETPWFAAQPPEPLYIGDCYCGTPGGGSGGMRCLIIPEGIAYVAAGADFHSYWHSIKTPESLCRIGRLAFATNHCLEELSLGEGLNRMDDGAFYQAERLKNLYLPSALKRLGKDCFKRVPLIESVSLASSELAQRFSPHKLVIRSEDGERCFSKAPPIVIPLTDRIRAYPPKAPFFVAGKSYSSVNELTVHPLPDSPGSFLDVHGREIVSIAVVDHCRRNEDGDFECVHRWFYKEGKCITQIEVVAADGTTLVREGISRLDVPYVMRSYVSGLFKE